MIRVFIAIQFPAEIKHSIDRALTPLRGQIDDRTVRWVDPYLYHLTLKFLGDVDDGRLAAIKSILSKVTAAESAVEMNIGDFGVFPNTHKPRVLWVGIQEKSNVLQSLKNSLENKFEPEGFKVETRKYHPHITVGRVRRNASKQSTAQLATALGNFDVDHLGTVATDTIQLVRSELTPSGPIYTELARSPLGKGDSR